MSLLCDMGIHFCIFQEHCTEKAVSLLYISLSSSGETATSKSLFTPTEDVPSSENLSDGSFWCNNKIICLLTSFLYFISFSISVVVFSAILYFSQFNFNNSALIDYEFTANTSACLSMSWSFR